MKVTFIHRTPGAPDLLTVKAINALMCADLLLAKPCVREEIAEFVPATCHTAGSLQEALRFFPASPAEKPFLLVRVVSGDPVNAEMLLNEVKFFENAGFMVEIIPGVSQIHAVPASRRFPLTRRDGGQSFWVTDLRLTTSLTQLRRDLRSAAASTATLVLLNAGVYKTELLTRIRRERGGDMMVIEQEEKDLVIVTRGGTPPLSNKIKIWDVMIGNCS